MIERVEPLRLCDCADAGRILGLSRQRVWQLAREHPEFPKPAARLEHGAMLWHTADIERFARIERKTGAGGHHARTGRR